MSKGKTGQHKVKKDVIARLMGCMSILIALVFLAFPADYESLLKENHIRVKFRKGVSE